MVASVNSSIPSSSPSNTFDIATGTPDWMLGELRQILPESQILHSPIDLIAFASDASFYRLIPKAVVFPKNIREIQDLFEYSQKRKIPMTFRGAGTSLAGQAITDGILVETKRFWQGMRVEDEGKKIRVQPGIIGGQVNLFLQPYKRKMGPDPSSINACTMGGILANNSSGMCCGVVQNAYHTLDSITFVLPSGTVIDTSHPDAEQLFRQAEPQLAEGLLNLRQKIVDDEQLHQKIRSKYRMKNTTGYSLNAFIDYDTPLSIFSHLLIGSEGTLAFIAEAVLNTVPLLPHKYTGLLVFPSIHAACDAIAPFRDAGAKALELMDRAALRSVEDQKGVPPYLKTLPDGATGLLVEFQVENESEIPQMKEIALKTVATMQLLKTAEFTEERQKQEDLWNIRKGMYPSVGAVRKSGTSAIIEDVAFPLEKLADATVELTKLFKKHNYENAIIWGHGKEGNLHFVITQSFQNEAAITQYQGLIEDVVPLVIKNNGSLKAEHGAGRNMAPFIEAEWGEEALLIMQQLKTLIDPLYLLNPGVIVNQDPQCYLKDLKSTPTIEDIADKCIECGYCEHLCPSRELTLTPRQRIVVRREMARQELHSGNSPLLKELQQDFTYKGLDTCAGDGMCSTACPVGINTGEFMRQIRYRTNPPTVENIAKKAAVNFAPLEKIVRFGLFAGHLVQNTLGAGVMIGITGLIRQVIGQQFPLWSAEVPLPNGKLPKTDLKTAKAIFLPSCMTRICGNIPHEPSDKSIQEAFVELAKRADFQVHIPDASGNCCGLAFEAKGFVDAQIFSANQTVKRCWNWTEQGKLPVVMDASACSQFLRNCRHLLTPENQEKFDQLKCYDSIDFIYDHILPKLSIKQKIPSAVIHPMCSMRQMGLTEQLREIIEKVADEVILPPDAGCCGFAGDRGFLFPELTASATKHEAADIAGKTYSAYVSSNRMCEVGMTRATGQIYRSYIHLLEEGTRE